MRFFPIPGLLAVFCFCGGCRTTLPPSAGAGEVDRPEGGSFESHFERGKQLLESGYNLEAAKEFAYLRDHVGSPEERDRASIGLAMALHDSGNSGAALGAIEPLPVLPKTATEARKCVLAGELHLHLRNLEVAEVWLARGLEVEPDGRKPYRGPAFFNLGKALLGQDKLEDALSAFEMAKEIFSANGDTVNVAECGEIIEEIKTSLL